MQHSNYQNLTRLKVLCKTRHLLQLQVAANHLSFRLSEFQAYQLYWVFQLKSVSKMRKSVLHLILPPKLVILRN